MVFFTRRAPTNLKLLSFFLVSIQSLVNILIFQRSFLRSRGHELPSQVVVVSPSSDRVSLQRPLLADQPEASGRLSWSDRRRQVDEDIRHDATAAAEKEDESHCDDSRLKSY